VTAETLLTYAEYWLYAGAVVAALFLTIGMDRIDEDARGAYIFRPLLIPGVLLIWPIVLWRWVVLETGLENWRFRHSLSARQEFPTDARPVLLEAPQ